MQTTDAFDGLSCTDCGESFGVDEHGRCPDCGAPLSPTYDLDAVDAGAFGDRDDPAPGQYRFGDLLPFPAEAAVAAGEGDTPLVRTDRLAEELGVATAYVKDEGRNPTGTYVDRGMSLAVTAAADRELSRWRSRLPATPGSRPPPTPGALTCDRTRSSPRGPRSPTRRW